MVENAGFHTATQLREFPIQTPSDMRKLFERLGVNYSRQSADQVQNALAKAKKAEQKQLQVRQA